MTDEEITALRRGADAPVVAGRADVAELLTAAHVERGRIESMPLLEAQLPREAPAVKARRRRATSPQ